MQGLPVDVLGGHCLPERVEVGRRGAFNFLLFLFFGLGHGRFSVSFGFGGVSEQRLEEVCRALDVLVVDYRDLEEGFLSLVFVGDALVLL